MDGIAHLNADSVIKIAVKRSDYITPVRGKYRFLPGVGHMDVQSAIDLFGDLLYSSNQVMVSEVQNESLNQALLKAEKFTLKVTLDPETGALTWTC